MSQDSNYQRHIFVSLLQRQMVVKQQELLTAPVVVEELQRFTKIYNTGSENFRLLEEQGSQIREAPVQFI